MSTLPPKRAQELRGYVLVMFKATNPEHKPFDKTLWMWLNYLLKELVEHNTVEIH